MLRSSRAALGALTLVASLSACKSAPPQKTPRAVEPATPRASTPQRPHSWGTRGPLIAEYDVRYDGHDTLDVQAVLGGDRMLAVDSGAERFVQDLEVAAEGSSKWVPAGREGRSFVAPACATKCRVRYRFRLREAGRDLDSLEIASDEGEVLEAPPSTWLLAPVDVEGETRARFRVTTPPGTTFRTGVLHSPEVADAWDIALGDLWTAPYSAFGPLRTLTLERGTARIDLAIAPGKLTVTDEQLVKWTGDCARAIAGYFGRLPMPEALVIFVPSRGRSIGEGKTLSGGGGAIFMRIGENAPMRALERDWVLVHEMTHLTFPSVAREHTWAEEGLATYVEPFARARAGLETAEDAWHGLVEGLPNGLPREGDRGLDRTPTWGRTYWGGALFYLLADVEIRKRTHNEKGLEHALRGILAAGGSNAQRWELDDVLATGDRATGVPVLRELHAAMKDSPHPVDLDAMWKELGIVRANRTVRFDDGAPLAAIRRAITTAD